MGRRLLIFDLFGTLCGKTSPEKEIIRYFHLSSNIHDTLQRAVCGTKFTNWRDYLSNVAEKARIVNNESNRNILKNIIDKELGKASIIPEDRDEVLLHLKKEGYQLGIISNAYPSVREKVIEKQGLNNFFKNSFICLSYEVGMIKQNPGIYKSFLERTRFSPENAIMIGDGWEDDIIASKKATKGKIEGILITEKKAQIPKEVITIEKLKYLPKAIKSFD